MKNLIKIKEDFISESVDKDFPIHKLADELMKRAYNQALEDVKEKAKRPDTDMYDSFIDEDLIDKLKIK